MELATIDPQSHKGQAKLFKIPSLVYIDPIVRKIQSFENVKIYKEIYRHRDTASGWRYICLLILTFSNRCISMESCEPRCALSDYVDQ